VRLVVDTSSKELVCGTLVVSPGDIAIMTPPQLPCFYVSVKGIQWRNSVPSHVCFVTADIAFPVVGGLDSEILSKE